MRILLVLLYSILLLVNCSNSVDNSISYNSKDYRIIQLQQVKHIPSEGDGYILKAPKQVLVSEDGSYFVCDKEQILKFSHDGKFLVNLYKKGIGPGEIIDKESFYTCGIHKDRFYLFSTTRKKLIVMDLHGKLIYERKLPVQRGIVRYLGQLNSQSIFAKRTNIERSLNFWIDDIAISSLTDHSLSPIRRFRLITPIKTFNNKPFIVSRTFLHSLDNNKLFISHTPQYNIKVLNLKTGTSSKQIRRPYKSIETTISKDSNSVIFFRKDLFKIIYYKHASHIWARTSTHMKEHQSFLWDSFDLNGKYNFSFVFSENDYFLGFCNELIIQSKSNNDYNPYIVFYKMLDYGTAPVKKK